MTYEDEQLVKSLARIGLRVLRRKQAAREGRIKRLQVAAASASSEIELAEKLIDTPETRSWPF